MAAPSGIVWGSIANDYARLGIYTSTSSTNTQTTVSVEVWLWSKYSIHDSSNTYYFDNLASSGSATTSKGAVSVYTDVDSGSGWSTSNQQKIGSYTYKYNRQTVNATRYLYAKIINLYTPSSSATTITASATVTIPKLPSYTVSYNVNGGTGTTPASQTKYYGTDITLRNASGLSKTGHSFSKWNTKSDGSGTAYNTGAKYSANANATMYAIWSANSYTVTYNANGSDKAAPSAQKTTYGKTVTLPTATRTNYNFIKWNTRADGKGTSYNAGSSFTVTGDVTLYAIWELAWLKPKIYSLKASRYEDYVLTDQVLDIQNGSLLEGVTTTTGEDVYLYTDPIGQKTYYTIVNDEYRQIVHNDTNALINFDWETTYDVTSINIAWSSISENGSTAVTASGKSGTVSTIVGNYTLNPEAAYTITITVADSNGSNVSSTILPGVVFPIDVYKEGAGIAFGKAAELAGTAEFAWAAKFNGPVYGKVRGLDKLPQIPNNSDFNDYMSTGCWAVYRNADAETMTNIPVARAGCLEVISSTGEGIRTTQWSYIRQRYTAYNKENAVWERDIIRGADNVWTYSDWWQSSLTPAAASKVYHEQKILWEGGMYMTANHTINLSEAVSKQANGIVLTFSKYSAGAENPVEDNNFNNFFVPKIFVTTHKGYGNAFTMMDINFGKVCHKYLYINDTTIGGHAGNANSGTGASGITYANDAYVLRYVYGV